MDRTELTTGTLFDIQGFSVHDGPGCRTLVFLKGCSLHCAWCANPEGIAPSPEPLWNSMKCTFDLACVAACPYGAISLPEEHLLFDRSKCYTCASRKCSSACYSGALNTAGFDLTVEEVFSRITRDRQYWGPDGGVTLTGGEPFIQPRFTHALLKRCYDSYIHTAVETCGNVPWENIASSLPHLDWIFFDLKYMLNSHIPIFPYSHIPAVPSSPLKRIQANARRLAEEFTGRLVFRMPVIPGINNSEENIEATARFIRETGKSEVNILPVHHMGREKYALLGQNYYTTEFAIPSKEAMQKTSDRFRKTGIECYIGSETPF